MTITVAPARNEYTSSAGQTIFNYTFKIFENTDLNVYITPSGQECSDSDLTTAYTVSGIGDPAGGSITLNTPASDGDLITIVSAIPSERTTDYQNNGDFRPDTVNEDFDRVVSIVKKIEDKVSLSPSLPNCYQGEKPLKMPAPEDGKALIWNESKKEFENYKPLSGLPTIPGPINLNNYTNILYKTLDDAKASIGLNGELLDPVVGSVIEVIGEQNLTDGRNEKYYVESGVSGENDLGIVKHNTLDISFRRIFEDDKSRDYEKRLPLKKGVVSIVYDAAYTGQYTVVKPLLDARNLKCAITVAARSFFTGTSTYMTAQNLLEFLNEGHEVMSHTVTTPNWSVFGDVSESRARWEFAESKRMIEELGFPCYAMQTPQTDMAEGYRVWAKDYFDFVFTEGADGPGIDPELRCNATSDRTGLTVMSIFNNSEQEIYDAIDAAEQKRLWLVLKDHEPGGGGYPGGSAPIDKTTRVFDYIKSKVDSGTIENLTPHKAFSKTNTFTDREVQAARIEDTLKTIGSDKNYCINSEFKVFTGLTQPERWVLTNSSSDTVTSSVDNTEFLNTWNLDTSGTNAANEDIIINQDIEVDRTLNEYLAADITNGSPLTFSIDCVVSNQPEDLEYEIILQGRDAFPNGSVVREERKTITDVRASRTLSITAAGILRNGGVKSIRAVLIIKRTVANLATRISLSQPLLKKAGPKVQYTPSAPIKTDYTTQARVSTSTNAPTGVKTKIPYASVVEGNWNGPSNSYFAEVGGIYVINAHAYLTNLSTDAIVYMYVDVDGVTLARAVNVGAGQISCQVRIPKGAELTIHVNQQSGVDRSIRTDLDSCVYVTRIAD